MQREFREYMNYRENRGYNEYNENRKYRDTIGINVIIREYRVN